MKLLWSHRDDAAVTDSPATPPESPDDALIVYGTAWCGDCHRARRFLDRNNVSYRWVDADEVAGAAAVIMAVNKGRRTVPTLVFPDGTTMSEPSNAELARKLGLSTP